MLSLKETQAAQGAQHASDGIPLHFGDQLAEYEAAQQHVALLDRSHEGRLQLTGADRLEVLHRISTNDLHTMQPGEGRATVFTKANARIIDRLVVYNLPEQTLALAGPGRGGAVANMLQRQVFFNDDMQIADITPQTAQFTLHGPQASQVLNTLGIHVESAQSQLYAKQTTLGGVDVIVAQRKPLVGPYWSIIVLHKEAANLVWQAITQAGQSHGLRPAGSLTYNALRIQSGRPAIGRELTADYLPLEVGLWDEVSFTKGCYTGQEIIARMESRSRLAKVLVRLQLPHAVETPASLHQAGRTVGTVTSSVAAPDGTVYAIGVVKTSVVASDDPMELESGESVSFLELAAAPPPAAMLNA